MNTGRGCPYCLDVPPEITKSDLANHVKAKHDIKARDYSEYTRTQWNVEGKEFVIFEKKGEQNTYCCATCSIHIHDIIGVNVHLLQKHIRSWEEKESDRAIKRDETKASRVYCSICWLEFSTQCELDCHNKDKAHKNRIKYEEGAGCDDCRQIIVKNFAESAETHNETKLHIQRERYEGGGCDICKLDWNPFYCASIYATAKEAHDNEQQFVHKELQNYVEGTGCDICRLVHYFPHEESKKHKLLLKRKKKIYDRFVAPSFHKSARK